MSSRLSWAVQVGSASITTPHGPDPLAALGGFRSDLAPRLSMEPAVFNHDFDISVDPHEVLRTMGVPKRGRGRIANAPSKVLDVYAELKDLAMALARGRSVYVLCGVDEIEYHIVFRRASHLAFAVCTIGPDLERESLRFAEGGSSLKALVLDAIGTVAVESVAEETARMIRVKAEGLGLEGGVRFSPGYGRWPLKEQNFLFSIVDGGVVGVRLNPSCVMEPRKSVSFAMRIGIKPDTM